MNEIAAKTKEKKINPKTELFKKRWYKFSRSPMSMIGMIVVVLCFIVMLFAQQIAPYPEDAEMVTHMAETFQAPSGAHIGGTDEFGRDVFSRALIGLRFSLLTSIIVLGISVPLGITLGLLAGYYRKKWVDTVISRFTEMFMAIPSLIISMVICTLSSGGWLIGALSLAAGWWAWYCRMTYTSVISVSNELFVTYTELSGVKMMKVIFQEVLPNIISPIITKVSLDVGSVIIMASSLNFIGLGVQPPTPSLGSMVSDGISYLPEQWWICAVPALLIVVVVLGFNLLGDGLGDALTVEEK